MSCDVACELADWSAWTGCSAGCGGGIQERKRAVLVPAKGSGDCPKPSSDERVETKACNEFPCHGDERCIAKEDLVVAIDASGSTSGGAFDVIRDLAVELVKKFNGTAYGHAAMRVGVVQFGNGEILEDGTVTSAIAAHDLDSDMAKVVTAI